MAAATAMFAGRAPCGKLHCEWMWSQAQALAKDLDAAKARLRAATEQAEAASSVAAQQQQRADSEGDIAVTAQRELTETAALLAESRDDNEKLRAMLASARASEARATSALAAREEEVTELLQRAAASQGAASPRSMERADKIRELEERLADANESAREAEGRHRMALSLLDKLDSGARSVLSCLRTAAEMEDDTKDGDGNSDGGEGRDSSSSKSLSKRMELIEHRVRQLVVSAKRDRDRHVRAQEALQATLRERDAAADAAARNSVAADGLGAERESLQAAVAALRQQVAAATDELASRPQLGELKAKEAQVKALSTALQNRDTDGRARAQRIHALEDELGKVKARLNEKQIQLDLSVSRAKSLQGVVDAVMAARDQERSSELEAVHKREQVSDQEKKRLEATLEARQQTIGRLAAELAAVSGGAVAVRTVLPGADQTISLEDAVRQAGGILPATPGPAHAATGDASMPAAAASQAHRVATTDAGMAIGGMGAYPAAEQTSASLWHGGRSGAAAAPQPTQAQMQMLIEARAKALADAQVKAMVEAHTKSMAEAQSKANEEVQSKAAGDGRRRELARSAAAAAAAAVVDGSDDDVAGRLEPATTLNTAENSRREEREGKRATDYDTDAKPTMPEDAVGKADSGRGAVAMRPWSGAAEFGQAMTLGTTYATWVPESGTMPPPPEETGFSVDHRSHGGLHFDGRGDQAFTMSTASSTHHSGIDGRGPAPAQTGVREDGQARAMSSRSKRLRQQAADLSRTVLQELEGTPTGSGGPLEPLVRRPSLGPIEDDSATGESGALTDLVGHRSTGKDRERVLRKASATPQPQQLSSKRRSRSAKNMRGDAPSTSKGTRRGGSARTSGMRSPSPVRTAFPALSPLKSNSSKRAGRPGRASKKPPTRHKR